MEAPNGHVTNVSVHVDKQATDSSGFIYKAMPHCWLPKEFLTI